ncbi:MAG: flavodoxin family protein [Fusobacteriaceae bacterium]|nr:flavodoxin family protein [Fusobacteriaceae bacterium]MBN2839265.1 flavodoxin family protein [Fusobacteriaceae bacterium]
MKILGISAGTKNGRNDAMCKEALRAAKENGAEIEFIRLLDLDIKHCTGCTACVKAILGGKGNLCVFKDDFDWFLEKFYEADGIIFSIPIFEKGTAGIFRTIMDRFGPRMSRVHNLIADKLYKEGNGKEINPKFLEEKAVSYMALGGSEWITNVESEFSIHALTIMGKIINKEVFPWSTGIMVDDKRFEKAHEIGLNMVEAVKDIEKASYKSDKGVCPNCHSKNFYFPENSGAKAICCQCGIEGEVSLNNGIIEFNYSEDALGHAHTNLDGQIIHANDIKKNLISLFEDMKTDKYKERMAFYKDFIKESLPNK